ncbi:hypothetical protein CHS0354_013386, partial [Potamilus streckersoni]
AYPRTSVTIFVEPSKCTLRGQLKRNLSSREKALLQDRHRYLSRRLNDLCMDICNNSCQAVKRVSARTDVAILAKQRKSPPPGQM